MVAIEVSSSAVDAHLRHGDVSPCRGACLVDTVFCGGFAGVPPPPGALCVDDPCADCVTECFSADCPGIAVIPAPPGPSDPPGLVACGGPDGLECAGDEVCLDSIGDGCNADCGGEDCWGVCYVVLHPPD